jgi:hypothetical protein
MAGYTHGENNFSDDDLDDLPANTLAELENNAIRSTQAANPQARLKVAPSSDYGDDFDGEDLDDAVVIDESRSTPAVVPALNRNNPDSAAQRTQFRQQRYGNNTGLVNRYRPDVPPYQSNRDRLPVPVLGNTSVTVKQGSQSAGVDEAELLRRQIEEVRCNPFGSFKC